MSDRSLLERAQKVIGEAQLGSIRLKNGEFGAHIREPADIGPSEAQLSHAVTLERAGEEDFYVYVLLTCEIKARDGAPDSSVPDDDVEEQEEGDHSPDSAVWVRAVFELHYRLPGDVEAEQDEINAFAQVNGPFNSWSYFREFLDSSMARMKLPSVNLPLFKIQDFLPQESEGQASPDQG